MTGWFLSCCHISPVHDSSEAVQVITAVVIESDLLEGRDTVCSRWEPSSLSLLARKPMAKGGAEGVATAMELDDDGEDQDNTALQPARSRSERLCDYLMGWLNEQVKHFQLTHRYCHPCYW